MKITNDKLLRRFKGVRLCECCRKKRRCDAAHLWSRGCGGGYRVDIRLNVASLCRVCHELAQARPDGGRSYLIPIVALRENVLRTLIEDVVPRIREWSKDVPLPPELQRWIEPSRSQSC